MASNAPTLHIRPTEYRARDGRVIAADGGTLSVPMRRASPDAGRVELAFVRLSAADPGRTGTPLVFLTGGPGLSAIGAGRGRLFDLFDALRSTGDVILLDQRGCGESTPSLACETPLRIPLDRAVTREAFTAAAVDAMRAHAARLAEGGIDVAAFNANESADDVADLVAALGYERTAVLGWSYGSHLAMAVIRRHELLVSRAVFAGPEGPDQTWKLPARVHRQIDRLSERAGIDVAAMMRAALDRVADGPVRVPWPGGDGAALEAAIGRFDLEWLFAEALADTRALKRLPAVLPRLAAGDFGMLAADPVLRAMIEELRGGLFRSPVRFCGDCASGASTRRLMRIERQARTALLGRTLDWPFPDICAAFGPLDLGDAFRAPLRSNLPVLFVTGTLDCRTPAENADDLAPGFPNAQRLLVEDAGHGDLLLPRAVHRALVDFFRTGSVATHRVAADTPFVPDTP